MRSVGGYPTGVRGSGAVLISLGHVSGLRLSHHILRAYDVTSFIGRALLKTVFRRKPNPQYFLDSIRAESPKTQPRCQSTSAADVTILLRVFCSTHASQLSPPLSPCLCLCVRPCLIFCSRPVPLFLVSFTSFQATRFLLCVGWLGTIERRFASNAPRVDGDGLTRASVSSRTFLQMLSPIRTRYAVETVALRQQHICVSAGSIAYVTRRRRRAFAVASHSCQCVAR